MKKNYTIVGSGVMALGLFFVCGCESTVMDERKYRPVDEPAVKVPAAEEAPAAEVQKPVETAPVQQEPVKTPQSAFAPMEGSWSNEGITEDGKSAKRSGKKTPRKISKAPNGVYTVKAGDTLGAIAYAHGVSLKSVMNANGFDKAKASRLRIGQKILIPGKDGKVNAAAVKKSAPKAQKLNTALLNADGTYTVKKGDNIPKIARKLGVKRIDLQNVNNLSDEATRRLQIGQKLLVPGKSAAAPVPVAPASAAPQDDLTKMLQEAEQTPAAPAPAADAPAATPAAATPAAPAADAPAATPAAVEKAAPANDMTIDSTFVEVTADTTIEEFAKANNTTVDVLRKLNTEISADGKLKAGELVFVPKK